MNSTTRKRFNSITKAKHDPRDLTAVLRLAEGSLEDEAGAGDGAFVTGAADEDNSAHELCCAG